MCRSLVLLPSDMNQHADSHRLYCDQKEWHTLTQFPTENTREQSWQGCFTDTCIKGHPICPLQLRRSFTKIKKKKKSCDDVRCFWLWDFLSASLCCKLAGKVTQTDTVSSDAGHLGSSLSEKKKIDICCFSFWPFSYEFPKFIKAQ